MIEISHRFIHPKLATYQTQRVTNAERPPHPSQPCRPTEVRPVPAHAVKQQHHAKEQNVKSDKDADQRKEDEPDSIVGVGLGDSECVGVNWETGVNIGGHILRQNRRDSGSLGEMLQTSFGKSIFRKESCETFGRRENAIIVHVDIVWG